MAQYQLQVDGSQKIGAETLAAVSDYVFRNIGRPIQSAEIARHIGVSPWHFSRSFRAATGMTCRVYITMSRVSQSKELMDNTDMSLVDIAIACGFASQSHFTTAFKRCELTTPAVYRASGARGNGAD